MPLDKLKKVRSGNAIYHSRTSSLLNWSNLSFISLFHDISLQFIVCADDDAYEFKVWGSNGSKIIVGCDWITDFNVETRRSNWCNRQTTEIAEHCADACNHCGCQDIPYFKFKVLAQGGGTEYVGCDWLTETGCATDQSFQPIMV